MADFEPSAIGQVAYRPLCAVDAWEQAYAVSLPFLLPGVPGVPV